MPALSKLLRTIRVQLAIFLLLLATEAAFATPVSDDFHANNIDTTTWSFVDPLQDSTFSINGDRLNIQVSASQAHDVWSSGNFAPRIMQSITDTDFEVVAKFETLPSQQYQLQGIVVESDVSNFIRFDTYSDGTNLYAFAAVFIGGVPTTMANTSVSLTAPVFLKINRSANTWTYSYSGDGANWTQTTTFDHPMTVTGVGPFAGNSGNNAPAFSSLVDYFFNTASPISNEDGGLINDTTAPNIYNQINLPQDNQITINLSTDEPSTATIFYGTTTAYELGGISTPTAALQHSIDIAALLPETTYQLKVQVEDGSGNIYESQNISITTLAAGNSLGPTIDVWYGDNQSFGDLGTPQRWINILGNVSDPDGTQSLRYSLNGGPLEFLDIGPNFTRLHNAGDFNVEIDYTTLNNGANSVEIVATDFLNQTSTRTVAVNYNAGTTPSVQRRLGMIV